MIADGHTSASGGPVLAYARRGALYLNLTSRCTLACTFCPKVRDRSFSFEGHDLRLAVDPGVEEVWEAARAAGLRGPGEVVFTGLGEPTRRLEVLLELIRRLKRAGLSRVRLDTDGLSSLREGRDVLPELAGAGLDAVSVSINAQDAPTYARLCPSPFGEAAHGAAAAFVRRAAPLIPEVVASAVEVPGVDRERCRALAESLGARFRLRRYRD